MGEYKTPGVYIKEINVFGNSVVEAGTAVPAFIGYTETAQNGNDDLTDIPWKISSMTEFLQYFGGAPELNLTVDIKKFFYLSEEQKKANPAKTLPKDKAEPTDALYKAVVTPENETGKLTFDGEANDEDTPVGYAFCFDGKNKYTLYYNMQLYFANGGGTCYVVSVGVYSKESPKIDAGKLIAGIKPLELVREITMVVIPEAVNIEDGSQYKNIQTRMLQHCGDTMKNRFAILDIYPKAEKTTSIEKQVNVFWDGIGSNFLSYGAAYYPWLNTSILSERDLNSCMFEWSDNAYIMTSKFTDSALTNIIKQFCWKTEEIDLDQNNVKKISGYTFTFDNVSLGYIYANDNKEKIIGEIINIDSIKQEEIVIAKKIEVHWFLHPESDETKQVIHQALCSSSILYTQAIKAILRQLNLLPPSAAIAGTYAMVDRNRGVWKAPANVTLSYVNSPAEDIDDDEQAILNAPMNGKAVNVIRTCRGQGVKVWGARTLDSNSLDWRYINVRRMLLFLEESVRNAARAYVFEPNDAGTWINMKCTIENFLRSVWKRGGLAGATPEDAFEVHIGLGDTMTGEDILEGIMRITVLAAVTHPAQFIEITFQQQMQKS